jgi:heme exporter protein A
MNVSTAAEQRSHTMGVARQSGDPRAAIEIRRLSVEFNGHVALSEVDLRIEPGQIVALLGANGAGKTTLLRCLAGLAHPTSGEVRWFGQPRQRNPALRRSIGMVAHQSHLYPELTPRENLTFAARMCDAPEPGPRVERMLTSAGLLPHASRPTSRLSRGQRQRLSVARALVHEPPILLLDEPFNGLDEDGAQWLWDLLLRQRDRAVATCLTTHDRRVAAHLADRAMWLVDGSLTDIVPDADRFEPRDLRPALAA